VREQPLVSEDGLEAIENIWTIADKDYVMPPVTLSPKEGREFEKKMAQIEAYVTEISVKIILGIESAAIYDEYNN
jgi:hypothetical protein